MANSNIFNPKIINEVEDVLGVKIKTTKIPPQGMDSKVFFAIDEKDREYAIKYGPGTDRDILAYKMLKVNNINIPVPKVLGNFAVEKETVLIMEKINFPLLEIVNHREMYRYIPEMIKNLREIHKIKSDKDESWMDFLLSKFDGREINWPQVALRKSLNEILVLKSVEKIKKTIFQSNISNKIGSFLHTDFNQRNLFVDLKSDKIVGIIDWGESRFGDPIYDFSRIRMLIWHFNMGEEAMDKYYGIMDYSKDEQRLDNLYWISRIIEYLAYYSTELNAFNLGRIKLHQDYLANYDWNG